MMICVYLLLESCPFKESDLVIAVFDTVVIRKCNVFSDGYSVDVVSISKEL